MPSAVLNGNRGGVNDDIVLTGLSGRLPESDNIEEFAQQLFDGVDLVTADDRRWTPGLHGLPERNGKLKDLQHFDATFFGVHPKQAHLMDPQLRLLLELTHEVIVDAGLNPKELRGSRTGVFVGVSKSESDELWAADPDKINGYALTGCWHAMFPNRISYSFDLKGPSYAIDTACSSSMFALTQAVNAMRTGLCDAAVVAGTNLCLNPAVSVHFHRLKMLSREGRCAAFDANVRGYVRSEAAVAVLLQRRGIARRVYATVRGARMNTDGAKVQGITFPSGDMQRSLMQETFEEAGLKPQDVVYVEAHGTGTKVGDPEEVNAIADFFCKDRKKPLLLGSVKSNMGHSEPAAGLCSVAKVLVAMERGMLPANLHYTKPNPDIPALSDGRIKVVDSNTLFEGGLVALNSFGFGGANAHVILESEPGGRPAPMPAPAPRLVLSSGRTDEAARAFLVLAAENAQDAELHALLDTVHAHNIPGHGYRGFRLLVNPPIEEITEIEIESRPVWFVFSGMGCQWAGMARSLLRLPLFASSIYRSAAALKPHGIDLVHAISEAPEKALDDLIVSFVSISAIQVALVDVLRAVGIRPDGIVGHSVGEIGCAYADETLTAEQAVLAAYWRGRSIVDAKLPPGAMAAVGLSWEQCVERCPPDIVPACHNAVDSVTISGPVESVKKFVATLSAEGVFTRAVSSASLAFHSKYIASAGPLLRRNLERVIPEPRARSSRWVSSSLPREQWGSDKARLSDASYFVNNLLSPVLFADAVREVPERAVLVEVAPHALLQAVLKRSRPAPAAVHVPLVRRDDPDACEHLLAALGRLYLAGAQPRPAALYPPVAWPVSRGTPSLSSRVHWDHSIKWDVAHYGSVRSGENVIEYDLSQTDDSFIAGHNIDGTTLFPPMGYLALVWRTVAKLHKKNPEETPIVLENVIFKRATIVSENSPVRFLINVLEGSGEFEVCESGKVAVTGVVRVTDNPADERLSQENYVGRAEPGLPPLVTDDIYKELRLRGYNYNGVFRGILTSDSHGTAGMLSWNGNWISFMDTMLQFGIIGVDTRELYLPTRIQRVLIDPAAQLAAAAASGSNALPVSMHRDINIISAGGIELRGVNNCLAPRANTQPTPKLQKYVFLPYDNLTAATEGKAYTKRDALTVSLQVVMENIGSLRLKVAEAALERSVETLLAPVVMGVLDEEPMVRVETSLAAGATSALYRNAMKPYGIKVTTKDVLNGPPDSDCHLVLASNVLMQYGAGVLQVAVLGHLEGALGESGMVLLEEAQGAADEPASQVALKMAGLRLVSRQVAAGYEYLLLRRRTLPPAESVVVEVDDSGSYAWLGPLRDAMKRAEREDVRVYLWSNAICVGLVGLATCLRGEMGGHALRVFYLPGAKTRFSPDAPAYAAQVRKDLAFNVLCAGVWGCYRHLPLTDIADAQVQVEHAYVNTLKRGDLSSLHWVESDLPLGAKRPMVGRDLCNVYYASLNFRDIMLTTGKLLPDALPRNLAGPDCTLGLEFSGRSSEGKRVMGIVSARGLATTVMADKEFMWEVPAEWSLKEAATVPMAYITAYYALVVRGRMRRGESVLVHAGSSGVGQAAIAIALHAGCTVFTTVGTNDKRSFLQERFPSLLEDNIGSSRDCSFEQLVLRRTQGRGVNLVLNSLAGEKLLASVRCLTHGGRFLEIGNNTDLGINIFLKNNTFHGILLDALMAEVEGNEEKQAVMHCMNEGIAGGTVRPLPAWVYSDTQLEQAFRFMATGNHIGKVLLCVREEEASGTTPSTRLVFANPRTYMHPAKSYILVGDLGGFGLELGQWLVTRGATTLVFNSRSGIRSGYQSWCLRRWREKGVEVIVSTVDTTSGAGARALMREAAAMAPVGGVFNLAVVLKDAFFENLTSDDFRAVVRLKTDSTKALDAATRELAPELDYFVVFSSLMSGRGNLGQSSYGFANSAMERTVEQRQAHGLPGLAIQSSAIGDMGLFMEMDKEERFEAVVNGTLPQCIASFMEALDVLLARPHAVVASMVLADKHRTVAVPQQGLAHAVANILGIKDPSKLSDSANLAELGMDSLISAEIKQTLEREYDMVLSFKEIRGLTFAKLLELGGDTVAGEAGVRKSVDVGADLNRSHAR